MTVKYAVGLDIGGSWIRAAMGDQGGRILRRSVRRVERGSPDRFVSQAIGIIKDVCGGNLEEVEGIGVGAAGRLDIRKGTIEFSPHASLKSVPLKDAIEAEFRRDAVVLNDCVAAAVAEGEIGAGRGIGNLVYIGIGTGIGAGIVVDGRVLLGKDGNAHEVGHMIIDLEGRLECNCGGLGHWEAYTSGSGIPKYARYLSGGFTGASRLAELVRGGGGELEAKEVFSAAYGGDPFAKLVIEKAAEINAKAFANIVNLYDPQTITVGGGLALKNPSLTVDPIAEALPRLCFNSPPKVVLTPLGEDAPLVGALLSAFASVRSRMVPQLG
ncbi:MAG: ROK family protein [Candidatus Methanosuratincola sp.]|jgi:glucokinase|nr:ROK family protein [Candidatus Methanosuratincola sp.]